VADCYLLVFFGSGTNRRRVRFIRSTPLQIYWFPLARLIVSIFWTWKMTSSSPSLEDYYELFQSHLLLDVLGLSGDSPLVRAIKEGVGIDLLNDFLLQPPTFYKDELTYVETAMDGSTVLMALHPTYVDLLTAFYWWCRSYVHGTSMPAYGHWIRTTRADFLRYLEGVLWKTGEVPRFDFPIAGVLPGTLLKVISRPAVPVQPPLVRIEEISPTIKEQVLPSHPVIAPVLPASPDSFVSLVLDSPCSPDVSLSLVGSPTCSLDILPSLANDIASPSCSVDISMVGPDNSYCLPENSVIPTGKLGPYVKNGFHNLQELATRLLQVSPSLSCF